MNYVDQSIHEWRDHFYRWILFVQLDLLGDEVTIGLHVFDTDPEAVLWIYWINGVELVAGTWVDRAKLGQRPKHYSSCTERQQRSAAMAPEWGEDLEIRIEFPDQADNRPNRIGIASSCVKTEIERPAPLLYGFLEDTEKSLLHIRIELRCQPRNGWFADAVEIEEGDQAASTA